MPDGPGAAVVAAQALALVAVLALPMILALGRGASVMAVADAIRVIGAIMAVAAGVAVLAGWKVVGRAFPGRFGAALVTYGALGMAEYLMRALWTGAVGFDDDLAALWVTVIVGTMVILALRSEEVEAHLAPVRTAAGCVAVGLVGIGLATVVDPLGGTADRLPLVAIATVWLTVGLLAVRARRVGAGVPAWVTVVMLVKATGALVRAAAPFPDGGWGIVSSGLDALATAVAVSAATSSLAAILASVDLSALRLRVDLDRLGEQLRAERSRLEERLHDLRNTVTAVRTADLTLRRYAGSLDGPSRAQLADSLTCELSRLQRLIEPGSIPEAVDFPLAEVLVPVVAVERAYGAHIDMHVNGLHARGDPAALAQVFQNLLVNARRYAPGAPVRISVTELPNAVQVSVQDDGPGIDGPERAAVFARARRGSTASGTKGDGLGLYVAARLMAAMGGAIRLVDGPGRGACFELDIPRATGAAAP